MKEIYPIGTKVYKLSGKPFKSMFKVNTISGIVESPYRKDSTGKGLLCYTFLEDDSVVETIKCRKV